MSGKKIVSVVVVALAAVALGIACFYIKDGSHSKQTDDPASSVEEQADTQGNSDESLTEEKNTESGDSEAAESAQKKETSYGADGEKSTSSNNAKPQESKQDSEKPAISVPGEIEDTGLYIEKLDGYSGIYVEDGSNDKVSNVATVLIKNNTGKIIQYAQLVFDLGDGKEAVFSFSNLPKGEKVMAFEQNRLQYDSGDDYVLKDKTVAYMEEMSLMEQEIGLVTKDDNSITITNLTEKDINTLRVFYKYKHEDGTYVGGITFTAKVENLKAGDAMTIYPTHFDHAGSEIMMVGQYEE